MGQWWLEIGMKDVSRASRQPIITIPFFTPGNLNFLDTWRVDLANQKAGL